MTDNNLMPNNVKQVDDIREQEIQTLLVQSQSLQKEKRSQEVEHSRVNVRLLQSINNLRQELQILERQVHNVEYHLELLFYQEDNTLSFIQKREQIKKRQQAIEWLLMEVKAKHSEIHYQEEWLHQHEIQHRLQNEELQFRIDQFRLHIEELRRSYHVNLNE